jgi:hypothetical protein
VVTARGRLRPALVALACVTALIAVLPDLAWGAWNKVTPVRYPPGWAAVAEAIDADPGPVAVLPADSMRRFGWAGPAPVLDPLPRWVRAEVLTTGDLTISGQTVPGEGGRARDVQRLLVTGASPHELAAAGVRWVVVEGGSAGAMGNAQAGLERLAVTYRDADLALYRVGGSSPVAAQGKRTAMAAAHAVWVALLVASGTGMVAGVRRRRRDVPSGT